MPNVTVRDLPVRVHRRLVRRANAAGMSLQKFLAAELTRLADRPTLTEALQRIDARIPPATEGLATIVGDIEDERAAR